MIPSHQKLVMMPGKLESSQQIHSQKAVMIVRSNRDTKVSPIKPSRAIGRVFIFFIFFSVFRKSGR